MGRGGSGKLSALSGLSLNNKEILCGEHVNCKLFLAILFNSCDWSKSFNTKNHPFKVEGKCIYFCFLRKRPLCRFMRSVCKNENTSMWGKHRCRKTKEIAIHLTRIIT